MSMSPEELRALMGEPEETGTTATTATAAAFIETAEERGARIIHDMKMMDAAFERWERDQGLNVLPFPSRGSGGDRAA